MLGDLKQHLQAHLSRLEGDWVQSNSGYENDICRVLGMQPEKGRHWDAAWKGHCIEFKKGRSIWLDLVRYSEALLKVNDDARRETICLFFVPNKERSRIEEVICVKSNALIEAVGLTQPQAKSLLQIMEAVPRSLNAQASLTVKDVKRIKAFSVRQEAPIEQQSPPVNQRKPIVDRQEPPIGQGEPIVNQREALDYRQEALVDQWEPIVG